MWLSLFFNSFHSFTVFMLTSMPKCVPRMVQVEGDTHGAVCSAVVGQEVVTIGGCKGL